MVILDTCALIELCKKTPSFSKKVFKHIENGAYILSISFAEIACKIHLGKLEMNVSPKMLYNEFCQIERIEVVNIGVDEWLDSIDLQWPHNKDPADRVITAFAIKNHLPIITSDRKIKQFYKKVIW